MGALRQLEFMKVKIDKVNKGLRDNFDKRRKDQIKINQMNQQMQRDQEAIDNIPAIILS